MEASDSSSTVNPVESKQPAGAADSSSSVESKQPVGDAVVRPAEEEKKDKKIKVHVKRQPKKYEVRVGDSTLFMTKSSPQSAARAAVRGLVKHMPLKTPMKVYAKSKSKIHPYLIERDYDNKKYRSFNMQKLESVKHKDLKNSPNNDFPLDW